MNAGALRERLTVQYPAYTRSTIGEETVTWTSEATVWGDVEPVASSAKEYLAMSQVQSDTTHMVRVRFREKLNHSKRFLYGTRVLKIQRVVDLHEEHRWLVCFCQEEAC